MRAGMPSVMGGSLLDTLCKSIQFTCKITCLGGHQQLVVELAFEEDRAVTLLQNYVRILASHGFTGHAMYLANILTHGPPRSS